MLGFSLPKILLLAVLLLAVWYGFKLFERRSGRAREEVERAAESAVRRSLRRRRAKERAASVETVECATCGSFVPRAAPGACGRGDCPHPAGRARPA